MRVGDKEFHDLRAQFEKDILRVSRSRNLSRESGDTPNGYWYCDAEINSLFNGYLMGYAYGKACFMNNID